MNQKELELEELKNAKVGTVAKMFCNICNKIGHTEEYCWDKKRTKQSNESIELVMIALDGDAGCAFSEEMALLHKEGKQGKIIGEKYGLTKDTFILDSGATSHMVCSKIGLSDLRRHYSSVKVGNSQTMYSQYIGTYNGRVTHQDG